jgi:hypothetical protein
LLFRRRNRRELIQPLRAATTATDPLSQVLAIVPDVDHDCVNVLLHLYDDVETTIKYVRINWKNIRRSIYHNLGCIGQVGVARNRALIVFHICSSRA